MIEKRADYHIFEESLLKITSLQINTYLVKPQRKGKLNTNVALKHDSRNYIPDALFALVYLLFAWRGFPIGSTVCFS